MKKLSEFTTTEERRKFIEEELSIDLSGVSSVLIDDEKNIHCENMVGAISLPLGVAGPVLIRSLKLEDRSCYIPLATTEGALVASVSRGCKAISECGGTQVATEFVGATRGPVFQTSGIMASMEFKKWLDEHFEELDKKAKETSSHIKLLKIDTKVVGLEVFMRFSYDTGDAMGMNMVTIATTAIATYIEEQTKIKCGAIAGNFDIDKKSAWLNSILGRGRQAWAEATISSEVVSQVLKTTPQKIHDIWLSKCMIGSAISGSLGFNSHFANIVAALYAATGQDLAHVGEGSMGITTTKVMPDGALYVSVHMPDMMIGTVGGGTKLITQTQARSICKAQTVPELAEVVIAAVLAGELSLLASLAQGSLAKVHEKLGR